MFFVCIDKKKKEKTRLIDLCLYIKNQLVRSELNVSPFSLIREWTALESKHWALIAKFRDLWEFPCNVKNLFTHNKHYPLYDNVAKKKNEPTSSLFVIYKMYKVFFIIFYILYYYKKKGLYKLRNIYLGGRIYKGTKP